MEVDDDNDDDNDNGVHVKAISDNASFIAKCEHVFNHYMHIEKCCKPSQSILTLENLAIYLETLKSKSAREKIIQTPKRKIPGYLIHKGRPNLIMCASIDQIPIALSIYAFSDDQPLPTNDECLHCSSDTTAEEVENFFRIAYKSKGDCIYTLIGMQDLGYDTALEVK